MNRFRVHITFANGVHTIDGPRFETAEEAQRFCENSIKFREGTIFEIWKLGEDPTPDKLDIVGKLNIDWEYQ
jgi:hypothetical protein